MIKTRNLALAALLGIVGVTGTLLWLGGYLHRPLQVQEPQVVQVPAGSGLGTVLVELDNRRMLGDGAQARLRRVAARLYNLVWQVSRRIHVGEYSIQPGDSLLSLLEKLERGDVLQRTFTIVEGWDIRQLRRALADAPGLVNTLAGVPDSRLMESLDRPGVHPEGWFAPDTYFYVAGTRDLEILRRALFRQEQILARLWAERDPGLPYADPYEALVMASIVEKETGVPSEREEIAGVFIARLLQGMRLQTDPTVIYGLGADYDGNIRREHLRRPTPYNTYLVPGLPPTPIAMPGEAAIRAALHPASTDALYFVARGDGSHKFSPTLEEHEAAVREFQKARRRSDYRSAPPAVSPPASAGER